MTTNNDTSLSGLWRANASKDPGTDLASIIDAARVITQSLLPNSDVSFRGMEIADTDQTKITLSAEGLGDQFPVPGDKVDRKLGETVHRIGHVLFPPDHVDSMAINVGIGRAYDKDDYQLLTDIARVFEDIYIDHVMTAYPGYHDYLKRERAMSLAEFDLPKLVKPLQKECDRTDMVNALVYLALSGGKLPTGITQKNLGILASVAGVAAKMTSKQIAKSQAIAQAYRIIARLPKFIDHNQDGTMDIPDDAQKDGKQEPDDQEQGAESSGSDRGDQQDGDKSGEQPGDDETEPGDESDKPDEKPDDKQDSGDESGDSDESDDEDTKDGEQKTEATDDSEPKEDSVKPEASDEMEPDEVGDDRSDADTSGDESQETEPEESGEPDQSEPEQFEPVSLASHLDDIANSTESLDEAVAQQVADAVVEKRSDLSQLISYLAHESDATIIAYTPDENAPAVAKARAHSAEAEEKLRRVMQEYRLKRTRDYRGLMSGRVSTRRLHRVAYGDQRVFQRREQPAEIDLAIALLFNMSGSTKGMSELIDQIVTAMSDAFSKEKVEFMAMGYSSSSGSSGEKVNIPRLYDKESGKVKLDTKGMWSSTPSYEGLAAAVAQLLRLTGNKQKVLIHFTDGEPNSSYSGQIPRLLEDARTKGITDIHICLSPGGVVNDMFTHIYGEAHMMAINDVNRLPEIIDQTLRQRLEL